MNHIKLICCLAVILCGYVAAETTKYYKCTTERGVVFSQFRCAGNATEHTITTTDPKIQVPREQFYKTLNNLEKKQIITNLQRALRAKRHEQAILNRDRDRDINAQQDSLSKLMSDNERKKQSRVVRAKVKAINKRHRKAIKRLNKEIARLEKKLSRYQWTTLFCHSLHGSDAIKAHSGLAITPPSSPPAVALASS